MAKALYDDIIEYTDGTPATTSQLAKDVSEFLRWSSEKSHDDKKKLLLKVKNFGFVNFFFIKIENLMIIFF